MIVNEPASPGRHLTIPRLLIAAAALVLALQAGLRLLSLPFRIWDNVKIAQIVGVWRGLPIYPGPGEAVTDWIYGPVGPIVFGPACLGTSADAMVLLGGAINLLLAIAPLAIAVWLATRRDATATLIATVALVGLSLTVTSMFEVACVIQMEAVGLAFIVAAACAVVPSGTLRAITAAGLLLALAVWTKQTFAFGAAGLVLFTAVHGGLRRACLLAGATFAACVALAIVFFAWFDRERMWFWMIEVPSRQPWVELLTGRPWDLGAVVVEVTRHLWVAAIIAAGGAWGCRQARVSPSPIAVALLWAAAAQLPVAVAGLQKVGGTCNHLGVISLLALRPASSCSWPPRSGRSRRTGFEMSFSRRSRSSPPRRPAWPGCRCGSLPASSPAARPHWHAARPWRRIDRANSTFHGNRSLPSWARGGSIMWITDFSISGSRASRCRKNG